METKKKNIISLIDSKLWLLIILLMVLAYFFNAPDGSILAIYLIYSSIASYVKEKEYISLILWLTTAFLVVARNYNPMAEILTWVFIGLALIWTFFLKKRVFPNITEK